MVNFTCDQCGRKYIYRRGLDRHVRKIILHIQSLAGISARGRLHDLIIWTNTSGPALVIELLLQLLKDIALVVVIFLSLHCERLVNRLEVL